MKIVKKFQLVLCENVVDLFDRLFELAMTDDYDARRVLAGMIFEWMIGSIEIEDVVRVVISVANIIDEDNQETRFNMVRGLLKSMVDEEVTQIIREQQRGGAMEIEYLKEET